MTKRDENVVTLSVWSQSNKRSSRYDRLAQPPGLVHATLESEVPSCCVAGYGNALIVLLTITSTAPPLLR